MIVTIDGPAGSGKSTVARRLASRLGIAYLDTGAMYRAIALKALQQEVVLDDAVGLADLAQHTQVSFQPGDAGQRVLLDGVDVSEAIRTMRVNEATPSVARVPRVREALVSRQRQLAEHLGSLVTEGRDQGSVVFPRADVKFVLDGEVGKRAQRRYAELKESGQDVAYEHVLDNLVQRDRGDEKHWLGLLKSGQAIRVDTTGMEIDEVVEYLCRAIAEKTSGSRSASKEQTGRLPRS
jgi:CMP/dCMP kinase